MTEAVRVTAMKRIFPGRRMSTIFCALPVFLAASPAAAYLGPGLGAGTLALILGFVASIFLALFAVFWYPIKRLIKGRKKADGTAGRTDTDNGK